MGATFQLRTAMLLGIRAELVTVEVSLSRGIPGITIVGRPDSAVMESRSRVRCAMRASGFAVPRDAVTVNLSPSELRKTGTAFDLPIALAILAASGQIPRAGLQDCLVVGELSLEGGVRRVRGLMAYAELARERDLALICPRGELAADDGTPHRGRFISSLSDVRGGVMRAGTVLTPTPMRPANFAAELDFADIAGQELAKRGLAIACAGGLGLLMVGPPGVGKTMLARCTTSILPAMSTSERYETAMIHSVADVDDARVSAGLRPFRSPHHSASIPGMVGGGRPVKPGEVSLAHNGVLFLDELGEFPRATLQSLRQPIEENAVRITRVEGTFEFPCSFQLIAASNPCPCGHFGDTTGSCTCTPAVVRSYRAKLAGPLADRIDMTCILERPSASELVGEGAGTSSARLREMVATAIAFKSFRQRGLPEGMGTGAPDSKSRIARMMDEFLLGSRARAHIEAAIQESSMSVRGVAATIRVARVIADMEESMSVKVDHIFEALCYRDPTLGA